MINYPFEEGQELPFDPSIPHADYVQMSATWKRCRDAVEGGVAIKAGGESYLPKLNSRQTSSDYDDYRDRAYWYAATGRTVGTFVGMIFRRNPALAVDNASDGEEAKAQQEELQTFLSRITSDGRSHEDVARELVQEVMVVNRVGVLEDYPRETPAGLSQLDVERMGLRSYTSVYKTEDIVNWKTEEVGGETVPTFFVLHETRDEANAKNPLVPKLVHLYRILYLEPAEGGPPVYRQALVRKEERNGDARGPRYVVEALITPLEANRPRARIPFWVFCDSGRDFEHVRSPVIYDLVEVNLAHYRNSADYEREIHKISIKTAIFPGWRKDTDGEPEIGGALATPPDQAPFILESGTASPLKDELTKKEERMATLGAQLLAQRGRYVQSAETAEITARGESSTVAAIARAVGAVLNEVLATKLAWSGRADVVASLSLNTDFDEAGYKAADLMPLFQMLQQGGLSFDTYYSLLSRQEVYPSHWTKEDELAAIAETQDQLSGLGGGLYEELMSAIASLQAQVDKLSGASASSQEEPPVAATGVPPQQRQGEAR